MMPKEVFGFSSVYNYCSAMLGQEMFYTMSIFCAVPFRFVGQQREEGGTGGLPCPKEQQQQQSFFLGVIPEVYISERTTIWDTTNGINSIGGRRRGRTTEVL